jgi:hypothetical protein
MRSELEVRTGIFSGPFAKINEKDEKIKYIGRARGEANEESTLNVAAIKEDETVAALHQEREEKTVSFAHVLAQLGGT